MTFWDDRKSASSRERPIFTPASARASTIRNIYAGPLPLKPVMASIKIFSSMKTLLPTESNMALASSMSPLSACLPAAMAVALSFTKAAMLGITRTRRRSFFRHDSMTAMGTPAAMDMMSFVLSRLSAVSFRTDARIWGFTAYMTMSESLMAWILSVVV